MQPILVRPVGTDKLTGAIKYEIIAGERRFRAAQLAGLEVHPGAGARCRRPGRRRDGPDREHPARGFESAGRGAGHPSPDHRFQFHPRAGGHGGRPLAFSAVSNLLRLMNLANPVQTMLMAGDIDMGHARALLSVDAATQINLANMVVAKRLSVRETEKLVAKTLEDQKASPTEARQKEKSGDIVRLEEELSDKLATPVVFKMGTKGRGQMIIDFADLDILDGVLARLRA